MTQAIMAVISLRPVLRLLILLVLLLLTGPLHACESFAPRANSSDVGRRPPGFAEMYPYTDGMEVEVIEVWTGRRLGVAVVELTVVVRNNSADTFEAWISGDLRYGRYRLPAVRYLTPPGPDDSGSVQLIAIGGYSEPYQLAFALRAGSSDDVVFRWLSTLARMTGRLHGTTVIMMPALFRQGCGESRPGRLGRSPSVGAWGLTRAGCCWSGGVRGISAFTGRTAQLGALRAGVRSGSTSLVVGDAGIGKSRLAAECAAEFNADGWLAVSASCLPLTEQLPLLPVVDGLRQLHLVEGGALLRGCLEDCPPYVRGDVAGLVPELTSPSTGTAVEEGPRQRLFSAVLQCWRAVHQRRPLLIVIEDLHWSDGATRDFLT